MNKQGAEQLLKSALNRESATFREGQWEAIDALVNERKKLLVVQRTGWGKSSVYFIATKILRDRGDGLTIIISPLLALMRNQVDAADKLGVRAATLNSSMSDVASEEIVSQILNNELDCLLVSPEKLAKAYFRERVLQPIAEHIGLFVVDEAHCISDWGHDFRPDYRRLVSILQQMPSNMPVLATTATANDRVIGDILSQLGEVEVQRGTLGRSGLALQNITVRDHSRRLAWLAGVIPDFPRAGIVYVLTKRDADQVASWLISQNINAAAYYSKITHSEFETTDDYREYLENQLLNNEIKVLVATNALGMGYDKPDLGFVIHYQAPGSLIAYYQQVGRVGRGIASSFGVLLSGAEDERIHQVFRRSAFPDQRKVDVVLDALMRSDGLSVPELQQVLNLRKGQIEHILKYLEVEDPAPVLKEGSKWYRTPVEFSMDREKIRRLTQQREQEWLEVQSYIKERSCLMQHLRLSLDDPNADVCGLCSNCCDESLFPLTVKRRLLMSARRFLRQSEFTIRQRKQLAGSHIFSEYDFPFKLASNQLQASEGKVLSRWNDSGWGAMVSEDKAAGCFRDELVEAAADMITTRWQPKPSPEWVTCVPSQRHTQLVPDFSQRLAGRLGLPFYDVVSKVLNNPPQKEQENSYHQCKNLDGVFAVTETVPDTPVLLVDDIIDSGWTVAILAALLRQKGSGEVYPFALTSSGTGD